MILFAIKRPTKCAAGTSAQMSAGAGNILLPQESPQFRQCPMLWRKARRARTPWAMRRLSSGRTL